MFSARQDKNESVASWGSRIDEMQTELREAARRIRKPEEILGAVGLICHLGKACFVQGLNNERIQTIVRSRGESVCYLGPLKFLWKKKAPFFPTEKNPWPQGTSLDVLIPIG